MRSMTLRDFLTNCSKSELTNRLILLDKGMMELHQHGLFVVTNLADIQVYDDQITLASFNNKVDYLTSGYNSDGDKKDILEMCAIGICAYNKFKTLYTNKEFINYLIGNLEIFLENGKIPKDMSDYYRSVLLNGDFEYLNNYLLKSNHSKNGDDKSKNRVYTKATAIGKALSDNEESAYINILIIPAILCFLYLLVIFVYIFFIR